MTSYIKPAKSILLFFVWLTQQKIYPLTTTMMVFELQNCVKLSYLRLLGHYKRHKEPISSINFEVASVLDFKDFEPNF